MELFFIVFGVLTLFFVTAVITAFSIGLTIIRNAPKWFEDAEYSDED